MKFGILLDGLGACQKNIRTILSLNEMCSKYDVYLFTNKRGPLEVRCDVPILNCQAAWHFDGVMIANSLDTAMMLLKLPTNYHKYFYVWEFQWMWIENPRFSNLNAIYNKLDLISPSEHYSEILGKVWKKPSYTLSNFHIQPLLEHHNEDQKSVG